jgi:hypothetical protein
MAALGMAPSSLPTHSKVEIRALLSALRSRRMFLLHIPQADVAQVKYIPAIQKQT